MNDDESMDDAPNAMTEFVETFVPREGPGSESGSEDESDDDDEVFPDWAIKYLRLCYNF